MTVSSEIIKKPYAGDDVTTVFPYTWKIYAKTDLLVMERDDTTRVETPKTLTTDYTVSGVGDADGGNVTMLTAPATGKTLFVKLDLPFTQDFNWIENDPFPADSHEDAADRVVKMTQILREKTDRALLLPITTSLSGLELPEKTGDGRILGWNSGGTAFTLLTDLEVAINAADEWENFFVLQSIAEDENTGVGSLVFADITTGYANTAFGCQALTNLTTGIANTFIGYDAGFYLTSGKWNVGVGMDAMWKLTTGEYNVAVGQNSGNSLTTGDENVFLGHHAGNSCIVGNGNVCVGKDAGYAVLGSTNIFIGYRAGRSETGSNKLYISNQYTAAPTIYGELDNHNLGFGLTSFGTNGTRVVGLGTGVAPTTSPANGFQMYSADQAAGNACAHFRTENGKVIKLYQQAHIADPTDLATCITAIGSILDALEALGLLATS